ncbi:DedA family protein [Neokomagataea anthophila]|uniref:VTT domain-containing protein n=1 Tax=Neokomagataea anthophila TaxID=2826925 RepID=A0ABS5E709_9PROT|nr:VTT domain-containing protein [Neokomagataea anthophila]MBR0559591.1 VTT domain-containing protein [Neokomagataea anthophila]
MSDFVTLLATQSQWVKAASIIGATFVLEDAATVMTALATRLGAVNTHLALIALWIGVSVGDLGLYGLGAAGARWPWLRRFLRLSPHTQSWFARNTIRAVALSRFIPGARLPLYTACGYFGAPFIPFAITVIGATMVWTTLLFEASRSIGTWLLSFQSQWRWVGLIGLVLTIAFMGRLIARLQRTEP